MCELQDELPLTNEHHDIPDLHVKHDDNHWVSDGNVIFSADSSREQTTYLFRIHKSLLRDHSEVFDSMFDLPQSDDEGCDCIERCDGLPLVRLPDSAEEVRAMLDALRIPLPFAERSGLSDTPLRIRDALHMASKYLMSELRQRLIRILESEWPITVDEFDARDELLRDYFERKRTYRAEPLRNGWPSVWIQEPAAAIALAEDFNIPSILPAAYYDLTRCLPGTDWSDLDYEYLRHQSRKPARWDELSQASRWKLDKLETMLISYSIEEVYRILVHDTEGSDDCEYKDDEWEDCKKAWSDLTMGLGETELRHQGDDLLLDLRELRKQVIDSDDICYACRRDYTMEIDEWRYAAWELIQETVCGFVR